MKRLLTFATAGVTGLVGGAVIATTLLAVPLAGRAATAPAPPTTSTSEAPATTSPEPLPATTTSTTSTTLAPVDVPEAPGKPLTDTEAMRPGARGARVLALQERLRSLGYWLGEPDGSYGDLTAQAVLAFQKVEGLGRDGIAGPATLAALEQAVRPQGRSTSGNLVEVDKERQVLLVIRDGAVAWAVNVSTGTEKPYQVNGRTELADTPPGRWTVTWVEDGVDWGELGGLYRPRYFHRDGIAVHGYHDVPAYPASHGCVRVAEPVMDWIWANGVLPIGSTVWVY